MFPDAQEILDTLEDNRDWYQSRIPISPSSSFCTNDKNSEKDEELRFQFDIEEEKDTSSTTDNEHNPVVIKFSASGESVQ